MERSFRVVAGFLFAASLFSCNFSKIEDFQLGKDFVSSTSGVVLIDTMKVVASTVHLDSIVTSKTSCLLIGGNQNDLTGMVTSSAYFQLHSGTFPSSFATDLVYDSLVVKFNYDGYYWGDTTKLISFAVKKLLPTKGYNSNGTLYDISSFKLNPDGGLYNTSQFNLSDEILADVHLLPRPNTRKDFYFRLSDDFGLKLFNGILNKNDSMSNSQDFKVFLPGMAFVALPGQNSSSAGILHSSISMRVYYHAKINPVENLNKDYYDFPIDASGIWYNQILYNSHGSILGDISLDNNPILNNSELPSNLTSNQTMIQAGSGVFTKIRIPGSQMLKGYGKNLVLLSASMQLTPKSSSYSITNPLPDTLAVYVVDRRNMITSVFTSSLGASIYALKVVPLAYDQLPYYSLDVTQFLTSEIGTPSLTGNSLMLGTLGNKIGQSVNYFSFVGNTLDGNLFRMSVYCYIDKSNR